MPARCRWVLTLLALGTVLSCGEAPPQEPPTPPLEDYGGIGGDFTLTDQRGEPFSLSDLRGRPALLFFGFTHCPDICPMTMSKIVQARQHLGDDAAGVTPVFVSVDPRRDTPERLTTFLASYGGDGIGLTGPKEEIKRVIRAYGGHSSQSDPDAGGTYRVEHSSTTYLIDQQGKIRFLFGQDDGPELMARVTRQLLTD